MDQPPSETSRSGMLLPEKYVQPYQQHIITSGNLSLRASAYPLLCSGMGILAERKARLAHKKMRWVYSYPFTAWGLPCLLAAYLMSPVPPGGSQVYRGRGGCSQRASWNSQNLLQESMTAEEAGIRPPHPRHTHTFLKNFSKLHGPTLGCWRWTIICHCKGRWERKFPLPALLFHLAHVQVQVQQVPASPSAYKQALCSFIFRFSLPPLWPPLAKVKETLKHPSKSAYYIFSSA